MTRFRRGPIWALAFSATLTGTQTAAAPNPDHGTRIKVVARLYNTARVPTATRDDALVVATRALSPGVDIVWRKCDFEHACSSVPTAEELVIRLVRSRTGRGNGAVLELGHALIDNGARAGVFATIYVDRVEQMADTSQIDRAVLLGRAIAHELGHLLLMTTVHTSSGLMRGQWTTSVIRRRYPGDWSLTREDVVTIRKRLP